MSQDNTAALEARIRDLEAVLRQNNHSILVTFGLSPKPSNLLGLLLSLPVVSSQVIQQRLEIASDAKVLIHRLRKDLDKFDIKIHSQRTAGYWLDAPTKQRIRQMLGEEPVPEQAAAPAPVPTVTEEPEPEAANDDNRPQDRRSKWRDGLASIYPVALAIASGVLAIRLPELFAPILGA